MLELCGEDSSSLVSVFDDKVAFHITRDVDRP